MGLQLEEATKLANDFFEQFGGFRVIETKEAEQFWFFVGGVKECPTYGAPMLIVEKENGRIQIMKVPSEEFFQILDQIKAFDGGKQNG